MAGTQESAVKAAGRALWQAKQDLEAAEKAPHTGSASTDVLKNAKTRHGTAVSTFDTAYTAYVNSMAAAGQPYKSKGDFIIR